MALIDYEFYKEKYGGTVVAQDSFNTWENRSSAMLKRLTYNHIVYDSNSESYGQNIRDKFEPFTDTELEAVQYGLCALMDKMYSLNNVEQQALEGNSSESNVKSRSSGGESISYDSRATAFDQALVDNNTKMVLYRNTLKEYMIPEVFRINPFYAGLRC